VPELPPGVAVCPTCGGELTELAVIGADPPLKLLDCGHCDQTFAQPLQ
jgi:transcription elongation factor Elf1